MLLSLLNSEEKKYFIDLLNRLVTVDGEKTNKEAILFERLRREIQISESYKFSKRSIDTLINYFAGKDLPIRKIVYLNLISISLNDDFYRVEEHILIEKIQQAFEINEKSKKDLMKIVYAERDIREKAKRLIQE